MRLSDFLIPVLAYVKSFTPSSITSAENLSDKIVELIDQARLNALNAGFPLASFESALFPVLAWSDEHLSTTKVWSEGHTWQNYLLQRRYFKTSLAGREFFDRLQKLDSLDTDVRELYVLCLCFGFLGKYRLSQDTTALTALCLDEYRTLLVNGGSLSLGENFKLFPTAYAGESRSRRAQYSTWGYWFRPTTIALMLIPPVVVLILLLTANAELSQTTDIFLKSIRT